MITKITALVGEACRTWRIENGYTQKQIGMDTGYVQSNISSFEHGMNDNMTILMWYVVHGFNPGEVLKGVNTHGLER